MSSSRRPKGIPRSGWDKRSMLPKNAPVEVPFVGTTIGPYVGFKVFEYNLTHHKVFSLYKNHIQWWPERDQDVAVCMPGDSYNTEHVVPDENHTCGYHVYYDLQDAVDNALIFAHSRVPYCVFAALVASWGRVIHHETGLRSSHLEIVAIHDGPYRLKGELEVAAEEMGVPYLPTKDLLALAKETGTLCQ